MISMKSIPAIILFAAICSSALSQIPQFTRIDTGAIYESEGTPVNSSNILFDIDNDGDSDPITSNMNAVGYPMFPLKLYRNERSGYYIQKKLISDYENELKVYDHSPMGDIDNDGDIDFIAHRVNKDLSIFFNDGYGNFLLDTILLRPRDNTSFYLTLYPIMLDFNKDGFLDIIDFNSVILVYYNDGQGKFTDIDTVGNFNQQVNNDWLHSMALGDADNDGDMDIYCGLSMGVEKNALFINTGISFEQVESNHIALIDKALTTSVHWVDYDNDGDMDLFTTNESPGTEGVLPALFENKGNMEFEKHPIIDEKYRGSFTISDYWGDLDNDGDQDLFITLEDGPFPFSGPYKNTYSPTTKNILYENEGGGVFTNILNHTLVSGEAHTAKIFDHDNDGDLDVFTYGNSYDLLGHNHMYFNEGNSNSFLEILCTDKYSCATPYGTRVCVKTLINGEFVTQIREINLIDGNVSFEYGPLHFGLGDAETVDSLMIRWPSGHSDTILNVPANQFYSAYEDSILEIDYKATNYIKIDKPFENITLTYDGDLASMHLDDYFTFNTGDPVPEIIGDTLNYTVFSNENPEVVSVGIDSGTHVLSIRAGATEGTSTIQVVCDAGFTKRMESFTVSVNTGFPAFTKLDKGAIYEFGLGVQHLSGIVADVDNDGDLDPVIGNDGVSFSPIPLVWYKNERKGLYRTETLLKEISDVQIVFTSPMGDLDNDGDLDMLGQRKWSTTLGVFLNDGFGNFSSTPKFSAPNGLDSFYPVLLDFNQDGFLDLIRFDPKVVALLNDGTGTFSEPFEIGSYQKGNNILQHSMSWADADNDGDMDAYCGMSFGTNEFFINTGSSLERLAKDHITLLESGGSISVNWVDYDNDGDMDLFTTNDIYENKGNLEFEKHVVIEERYDFDSVWANSRVWGDLDNDGDLDLFVSVENNPIPIPNHPMQGKTSSHPYNLVYLNKGNGEFATLLNHGLTLDDSHTAEIFDHDNDGDLDVLTIGNAWASNGSNILYINEGNGNGSIVLNCTDRYGCATPYGTRIYAKTMINGNWTTQTREITPVDGNLSFGNTRIHFGLGDAQVVDSLIIRWPQGHVDTYLDVPANQFYNATENSDLEIDYRASNYIKQIKPFTNVTLQKEGDSITLVLGEYFRLVTGGPLPDFDGEGLNYTILSNENRNVVRDTIDPESKVLTLVAGATAGTTVVQIVCDAGFVQKMGKLTVKNELLPVQIEQIQADKTILIYPNPVSDHLTVEIKQSFKGTLELSNMLGKVLYESEINCDDQATISIDTADLPGGLYLVAVRNSTMKFKQIIIRII